MTLLMPVKCLPEDLVFWDAYTWRDSWRPRLSFPSSLQLSFVLINPVTLTFRLETMPCASAYLQSRNVNRDLFCIDSFRLLGTGQIPWDLGLTNSPWILEQFPS